MKPGIPPLAIISLLTLCCVNAWLLTVVLAELSPSTPLASASDQGRKYVAPTAGTVPQKSAGAYRQTLTRPVFFKTRMPYLPPPPVAIAPPPPPQPPIVDPGLSVAGVIINSNLRKAYLLKQNDSQGTWVAEGDNILGWTVQAVTSTGTTLKQSDRTIELGLYLKP